MRKFIALVLFAILLCSTALADNDWVLTQYADLSGNQAMFYSLTNGTDLIIIDGGWTNNAPQVKEVIESNGGHITAWILTTVIQIFNDMNTVKPENVPAA